MISGQLTVRCDSHDVVFVRQTLKSNTRLEKHTVKNEQTDWVCLFFSAQSWKRDQHSKHGLCQHEGCESDARRGASTGFVWCQELTLIVASG